LARLLVARGEIQEALPIYKAGLEKQPESVALQLALAEAQEKTNDYTGARTTYEAILEEHSDNVIAANNLAALLADHNYDDPESVRQALALAKRFENSDNPYFVDTLGWVQYRLGDLSQARANLERAVSLMPGNPQLQYHLGMVLARLGEHDAAVEALQRALVDGADYPGVDEARSVLSESQRQKQDNDDQETSG
jgi:cellulose synthase operon protein C